ncbi:hypothetical protein [Cupriavidus sp. CuC1]|uniref:hypothetical protein n=1 Tax=Cupriavidus sp. CuC1 TaxID=3373131 RepID=UPI0037D5AAAD
MNTQTPDELEQLVQAWTEKAVRDVKALPFGAGAKLAASLTELGGLLTLITREIREKSNA